MTATIHTALVAALSELANPKKNQTADTGRFSYSYADLASVLDVVRPVLAKHQLAVMQDVTTEEGQVQVSTRLVHASGEVVTFGPIAGRAGSDWQAMGSAVTYARRYSLMAALGLAAEGEDDDGASAPKVMAPAAHDPWDTRNAVQTVVEQLGATEVSQDMRARKAYVSASTAPATESQLKLVRQLVNAAAGEDDPLQVLNGVLEQLGLGTVGDSGELTKGQASQVIDHLKAGNK